MSTPTHGGTDGAAGPDDAADPRTDADLLRAHTTGDRDAFAVLFARHGDRLWGLALRTLRDREDAADALQEAMVNACRGAASYRGDAQVSTWLHRIVVNACLDAHRRAEARPGTPVPTELLDDAALPGALDGAPADLGEGVAVRLDVEQALAALPFEQRAALVLVDVLGHDVGTAAALLDCPVGTIKSRCARGRARLAPALAHLRNPGGAAAVEHPGADHEREGGTQ